MMGESMPRDRRLCIFLMMANIIAKNLNPKIHSMCLGKECEHFKLKENSQNLYYCGISGESVSSDSTKE